MIFDVLRAGKPTTAVRTFIFPFFAGSGTFAVAIGRLSTRIGWRWEARRCRSYDSGHRCLWWQLCSLDELSDACDAGDGVLSTRGNDELRRMGLYVRVGWCGHSKESWRAACESFSL